jgi:hypothetical protein
MVTLGTPIGDENERLAMMNLCHNPARLAASAEHLRSMAAACALALAPLDDRSD